LIILSLSAFGPLTGAGFMRFMWSTFDARALNPVDWRTEVHPIVAMRALARVLPKSAVAGANVATALLGALPAGPAVAAGGDRSAVVTTYADIALAGDKDSLTSAKVLNAAIDALIDLTRSTERVVTLLRPGEIAFEGSDSLDAPEKVFQ
jgi:uncharacterized iron-regulated protein